MPWNKKKSYNLLKSDKKSTAAAVGKYTKTNTKNNISPSSNRLQTALRQIH